ncbi:GNAT family N-acetyltransferase [Actinoplanes sp. NPDC020271]|uniref:GNAT family N-acetyltransferase n=1 Tax=Actinoplanes sp. NPDC020271 TaxID=3363896 RepID=UPI0037AE6A48
MIRTFAWDDYDSVATVWVAAGADVLPRAELETKLARDPELFLVSAPDGVVAGAILGTWDGRRGWIFRLAVDPGHRRQGIATALVREVEARFRAIGCPRINLLVLPHNEAGLRFWQELGYLPVPDVLCTKPL